MTNYHLLQPGPSRSALFQLLLIKTSRIKQGSSRKSIYLWLMAMPEWEWRLGRGGQWGWILSASHLSTERLQIIWVCGAVSSQAFHAFADLPSALSPDPLCQHVPIVVGTQIPRLLLDYDSLWSSQEWGLKLHIQVKLLEAADQMTTLHSQFHLTPSTPWTCRVFATFVTKSCHLPLTRHQALC